MHNPFALARTLDRVRFENASLRTDLRACEGDLAIVLGADGFDEETRTNVARYIENLASGCAVQLGPFGDNAGDATPADVDATMLYQIAVALTSALRRGI